MKWFKGLEKSVRAGCETHHMGANAGYIVTRRGALLVDAFTTPPDGRELYDEARHDAGEITGLVYTHEHGDHVFGSSGQPGSFLVLASRGTAAGLRDEMVRDAGVIEKYGLNPRLPALEFDTRVVLPGEPEIHLVELGGHARGSTVVHVPSAGVVFTGDLVYAAGLAWVGDGDLERWVGALREIESWGATQVVPGHGPVGGPELLTRQREWLERFAGRLGELKASGLPAREVLPRLVAEFELTQANGYDERLLGFLAAALRDRFGFPA